MRIDAHRCDAEKVANALTFVQVDREVSRGAVINCQRAEGWMLHLPRVTHVERFDNLPVSAFAMIPWVELLVGRAAD